MTQDERNAVVAEATKRAVEYAVGECRAPEDVVAVVGAVAVALFATVATLLGQSIREVYDWAFRENLGGELSEGLAEDAHRNIRRA